jgi:cholesterol transport system auxiliary component
VHINAKLVRMPQRTIIASNSVEHIVPAGADDIDQIIQAFDEALGKVLKGIVEWTLITGSKVADVGA